jgi:hypothetical protein
MTGPRRTALVATWRWVILCPGTVLAATNGVDDPGNIPALRPPKPQLLPGFWEQHGLLVGLTALTLALLLVLIWRILSRPNPPVIPEPATIARQSLGPLHGQGEDAAVFNEVSRVLRTYLIAALSLPEKALTPLELCSRLDSHPQVSQDLAQTARDLLNTLESHRFDDRAGAIEGPVLQRALALIDLAEASLHPAPKPSPADTPRA